MPQRGQDRSPIGAEGEEYLVCPYSVKNYLGFRRISRVNVLVRETRIFTVPRKTGIPVRQLQVSAVDGPLLYITSVHSLDHLLNVMIKGNKPFKVLLQGLPVYTVLTHHILFFDSISTEYKIYIGD